MGCVAATNANHNNEDTKNINKLLSEERKKEAHTFKVLLLGPGGVGKSTFLRQLLNTAGSKADISRTALNNYILEGMNLLVSSLESEGKLSDAVLRESVSALQNSTELDANAIAAIKVLWDSPLIKAEQDKHLDSNHAYFFDDLDRITSPHADITHEDAIRVRIQTSGVQTYHIPDKNGTHTWEFIDVGGQRTERRKWIHAFEGVKAVIYLSSLAAYDQGLEENHNINRMHDDLELFSQLTTVKYLPESWIFFQNKIDLFEQKILVSPISNHFPTIDKTQETDPEYAVSYFKKLFTEKFHRGDAKSCLQFYTTCGLDTKSFAKVTISVQAHIHANALKGAGLM